MRFGSVTNATTSTIWIVVIMTLASELYGPFKELLAQFFWHHWVGKSVVAVLWFGIAVVILPDKKLHFKRVWWSAGLGTLIIFTFYTGHYLGYW